MPGDAHSDGGLVLAREANAIVMLVQDLPPGQRRAACLAQCGGDQALLSMVERLLLRLDEHHGALPTGGALAQLGSCPVETHGVGDRIGPYALLREIGRGGMAVVYLAELHADAEARLVALKLLQQPTDPAALERVRREACALATLRHPAIAGLLDTGIHAGQPYLVMEYVGGERIDHYCRRHALGAVDVARLVAQLARAVHHAHSQLGDCRLIHRDIKPGNVLVDAEGNARLLDFGIARCAGVEADEAPGRSTPHTPAFASPEQLAGREVTAASDIFQLGLLLQTLVLPGTHSAPGGDAASAIDPALERIIARATAEDPAHRHATAAGLADALEAWVQQPGGQSPGGHCLPA